MNYEHVTQQNEPSVSQKITEFLKNSEKCKKCTYSFKEGGCKSPSFFFYKVVVLCLKKEEKAVVNKLEFYVLNYNMNTRKIEPYNIFNNCRVHEYAEKAIRKYLRSPSIYKVIKDGRALYGFEALCEEIRSLIMWQEWSRCEYEIEVGGLFNDKTEKWDCYGQALPNIKTITRDIIYQYKHK